MKLLELLPSIELFKRIKRKSWNHCLIRSTFDDNPLVIINFHSMKMSNYTPTYEDLMADDWEIVK